MLIGILIPADDPAAPTIIEITCTTATVSWDEVDGATEYKVQWSPINGSHGPIGHRSFKGTNATITNLQQSSVYSVTVTVTSLQNGGTSPPVTFTTDCGDNNDVNGNVINYTCTCMQFSCHIYLLYSYSCTMHCFIAT